MIDDMDKYKINKEDVLDNEKDKEHDTQFLPREEDKE